MTIEVANNNSKYHILITGQTLNGETSEDAQKALAKLFKISDKQAQALFAKAPYRVKSDVDETTAKKYQLALTRVNVEVKVQRAADTPANKPKAASETVKSTLATASNPEQSQLDLSEPKPPEPTPSHQGPATSKTPATSKGPAIGYNPEGFAFTLEGQPDYAFLTVTLPEDQTIKVEASSMATMDTHIKMRTKAKGGIGRLLTGESLFINEFTAEHAPGEIGIAPGTPGDILHRHLTGENTLFLQNSAFLAASTDLNIETKLDIFKGIFSGAGLVLIKCSGPGDLWFNTYGAAIEIDVDGEYVVDTDKIIAWEDNLSYEITKVGGYKSLFFSGEGFVCRFSGKGKLWIQTRSSNALKSWAHWFRPVKNSN